MAHMVTCTVCKEKFDRDKVQAVKVSARRYAHYRCYPQGELVPLADPRDGDLILLEEYIKKLLGKSYNPARVKKQIKEYKEEYNYTYSGMLKTLYWFFEIKKNPIEKANGGIGIIPYVYKDACDYFYSIYLASIANQDVVVNNIKVKEYFISSPEVHRKPPKLFNTEEDE